MTPLETTTISSVLPIMTRTAPASLSVISIITGWRATLFLLTKATILIISLLVASLTWRT